MLVFATPALVYFAVPKTGSTAIEMALRPRAEIAFMNTRKHMTATRFHNRVGPFLAETFGLRPERFAVIRDPEAQLRSWYSYRTRDAMAGSDKSTQGLSFDSFVGDVLRDHPPPHAAVGSQWKMLTSGRGKLLMHHLFAYEHQEVLHGFLAERFGEVIEMKRFNVSPDRPSDLAPDTRAALRAARADEFALHAAVIAAGGHLRSDLGR